MIMRGYWVSLVLASSALILYLVEWRRARPGTGFAIIAPAFVVQAVAMIVGVAPQIFAPGVDTLRVSGSIGSIALTGVALFVYWRRRRAIESA